MKYLLKTIFAFCSVFIVAFTVVACGNNGGCKIAESVTLAKTTFGEVEFENSEKVKLKQDCGEVEITGEIEAMSSAQVAEFGVQDVTHVVVLKFMFDKERTISYFEIKGETTKVYSTNSEDLNYVGSISDLLDSESDEDAYCYLILSASTKEYELTSKYTDGTTSEIDVEIKATLLTAVED